MTAYQAGCPACGAQVVFKTSSSVVVVCEYCHSVVARTDRALEDLGKISDVSESGSPLEVGLRGVVRGVAFELTGRAQLGHASGGMWDEWYAAFADGRWGWLAEAQGRFYLTFQRDVTSGVPPFDALAPGSTLGAIQTPSPLVVAEKGEARMLAAEGEIPYRLVPGETYRFADLSGQEGVFGTIDYGEEPPLVFVGREVAFDELGIVATGRTREREARRVSAAQLNCPNCAGPLELRAPDRTERVTCPNCGSLLDVNRGRLRFLKALETKAYNPSLALGAVAEFEGRQFTLIGFTVRSVEFDGVRYFWEEYLLYDPAVGFRWLVQSDAHWSYVRSVPPGEVDEAHAGAARYGGKSYKIFQDATARVEYVQGEFYWRVEAGELTRAVDYINAPEMLSKEVSGNSGTQAGEINWSLGTYVPVKEIERKFKVDLPSPSTVAPNQPFKHKAVYKYWLLLLLAAFAVGVALMATSSRRVAFSATYTLQDDGAAAAPTPNVIQLPGGKTVTVPTMPNLNAALNGYDGTQVIFSEPFRLDGGRNIRVSADSNVNNNWLYVAGDLINEETGLVQQFDLPMEYYYGTEGGESWSEGGRRETSHLSALPAGTYTMRLEAQWEKWKDAAPPQFTVRIEQGVARPLNLILTLIALSIIPVFVAVHHFSFERRRWADSAFNPHDTGDGDDDDE